MLVEAVGEHDVERDVFFEAKVRPVKRGPQVPRKPLERVVRRRPRRHVVAQGREGLGGRVEDVADEVPA